jgi:hypothetical protein
MAESTPSAPEDAEDRLIIPLDPEVAIGALLRVDASKMPPTNGEPMTGEDMARKYGVDGLALRNMIRDHHDDLMPGHTWHALYAITPEIEAKIIALPEFQGLPKG